MAKVKTIKMKIPQGATYVHTFYYAQSYLSDGTPVDSIDLSSYTAELQFRADIENSTAFYTATDSTGEISCNNGSVVLTVEHADSTAWTDYSFVGSLEVTSPTGVRTRLIDIDAELSRETVRD